MAYLVNGEETVTTVKEVGAILGVKVTKKGILAGEYEGVEVIEDVVEEAGNDTLVEAAVEEGKLEVVMVGDAPESGKLEQVEEEQEVGVNDGSDGIEPELEEEDLVDGTEPEVHTEEEVPAPVEEEPKEEVADWRAMAKKLKQPEPKAKAPKVKEDLAGQEIEYPEVGHFESVEDIKKFYKRLSMEQITEWADIEGLEWKTNDNPGINRMRACMAISNHHFPKKSGSKKKAKYGHLTTEELLEMAIDNDIEVRDGKGNENILRMYTIMALKQAGILA